MFAIGSKVVHPCHGPGTVVSIDRKRIGQAEHAYYIIEMLDTPQSTQVMVPVKGATDAGLRTVGRPRRLRMLLSRCGRRPGDELVETDYKRRKTMTAKQLKSGSFPELVDMVRGLTFLEAKRNRPLGYSERVCLDRAKRMLAAELALAADEAVDDVLEEVEWRLERMAEAVFV
jgi:CarD family transcriptional regulator